LESKLNAIGFHIRSVYDVKSKNDKTTFVRNLAQLYSFLFKNDAVFFIKVLKYTMYNNTIYKLVYELLKKSIKDIYYYTLDYGLNFY